MLSLSLLGYAALLFTAAAAVVYLVQERQLKRKNTSSHLPHAAAARHARRSDLAIAGRGFRVHHGRHRDRHHLGLRSNTARAGSATAASRISFVTWGVYLALVFFRVSAGWRGRKTAILSIVALACCVVTWVAQAQSAERLMQ